MRRILLACALLAACGGGGGSGTGTSKAPPPPPPGPKAITGGWLISGPRAVAGHVPPALQACDRVYVGRERVEFVGPTFPIEAQRAHGFDYADVKFGGGELATWHSSVVHLTQYEEYYAELRWSWKGSSTSPTETREQAFRVAVILGKSGIDDATAYVTIVSTLGDASFRSGSVTFPVSRMK